jgi:hypothetical protein
LPIAEKVINEKSGWQLSQEDMPLKNIQDDETRSDQHFLKQLIGG